MFQKAYVFSRFLLTRILDFITLRTPPSLARSLEWRLQRAQGKGIGSSSVVEEVRTMHEFIKLLGITRVCILDVGANSGQYALQVKSQIANVEIHSFEPSVVAFKKLEHEASSFGNWWVHQIGLGSKSEKLELFSTEAGSASASLFKPSNAFGLEEVIQGEIVQIETLDDFLENNPSVKPNILKLDIEGFELKCLEGAKASISLFRIVQFEFGEVNIDARIFFRDFWNFFRINGFELHRITKGRPLKIEAYSADLESFSVTNYLAIRGGATDF